MEPEVFDYVQPDVPVDWSGDVFPQLMKEGKPIYGFVAEGYWEDVGTHESYVKAQADVLEGKVNVDIDGFEISPGVWVAEGAEVHPDAVLRGPLYIGDYAKVEAGAEIREHTVIGSNVVVKTGAFLHKAVVHDNVYVGQHSNLRGCVVGKNTDIMRAARIEDGAVIGDECLIGEESIVQGNVRVYPFKTIEAGAFVNTSVIWESRGQAHLFGARGVSGILNVEITPELAVRLAGAYATTLKKGSTVTTAPRPLPRRPGAEESGDLRAPGQRHRRTRPGERAAASGPAADRAGKRRRHHDPDLAGRPGLGRHHVLRRAGR